MKGSMRMDKLLLSCDWGTSSLRIRLVDADSLRVIAEEHGDKGIRDTFLLWKDTGEEDAGKRISFYLGRIEASIRKMEDKLSVSLEGVPLLLSGMASSSAGMMELPYQTLPFHIDRDELVTCMIPAGKDFSHPVLLMSGLTNGRDVMRGEEVQLIGCMQGEGGDGLYIFPGTHSKHILVQGRTIVDFKTYMTGEFFALLSQHSLLSGSVAADPELPSADAVRSFRQGVLDAVGTNLLHAAFRVRTNDLFGTVSKKENFHYLSGLLIGTELQALVGGGSAGGSREDRGGVGGGRGGEGGSRVGRDGEERGSAGGSREFGGIYLCCGAALKEPYERALEALGLYDSVQIFSADRVDTAVVSGQYFIFNQNGR